MTLFKGQYRVETVRLQTWDYSSPGYYFVTICTRHREQLFGEIRDGVMGLNEMGCLANDIWIKNVKRYANVDLDEFIVMPNHIHGILVINDHQRRDAINCVSTDETNVKNNGGITGSRNPMGENTLGEIIRSFKGQTTYLLHKEGYSDFSWQSRYHDRIIRSQKELARKRLYIQYNPLNWKMDRNNVW